MIESIGRGVLVHPPLRVMTANDVDTAHPSKRLAQKLRSLQPVPPRQIDRFCYSDPYAGRDVGLSEPRTQRKRRLIERQCVMFDRDTQRLAELARAGTQPAVP